MPKSILTLSCFVLGLLIGVAPAFAQPVGGAGDNPLAPALNSSPRDTLRSFLFASGQAIAGYLAGDGVDATYTRARQAADSLDYTTTPNGETNAVRGVRMLMLREILDRYELPDLQDIPGNAEVAAQDIPYWRIPGTRLEIVRIDAGPRRGEYLFSAATVAGLDIAYRRVKHLPRKEGAVPIYERWVKEAQSTVLQSLVVRDRLEGQDVSNPRATLDRFMLNVNRAYEIYQSATAALAASPPTMTMDEAREADQKAEDLIRRAARALDLSQVPRADREDVGIETVLQLKEILDRLNLLPIESVPNASKVAAEIGYPLGSAAAAGVPYVWTIPRTNIQIVRVLESDRAGSFVVSANSVQQMARNYESVKDLPYRQSLASNLTEEWQAGAISPGFYESYITTPGNIIAAVSPIGQFVEGLPPWMKTVHDGQTVWQWIGLALVIVLLVAASFAVFRSTRRMARRTEPPVRQWVLILPPLIGVILLSTAINVADNVLNITLGTLATIRLIGGGITVFLFAAAAWRVLTALVESYLHSPMASGREIDASLIRLASNIVGLIVAIIIITDGMQDLGADLVPLIAGLGVGGLAVALAARPTLENLIGGLILYIDRPLRVGDYCNFGANKGTIEEIGVRSTRIRGLDRTIISIPNARLVDMEITNWARCDRMLIQQTIGLRYETTPDQLRFALVRIREMLLAHPKIDRETVRIRFIGYGASSLDISIRIYALTHDWNDYYAIQEDVLLRISDVVTDAGTGFAFPSQTLYMARDTGLDDEKTAAAAQEVDRWRRSWRLPFPRMRAARRDELAGTLDYPPRGSAEATIPEGEREETAEPLSAEPVEEEKRE